MIKPNRRKSLQEYLLGLNLCERVWALKVETGDGPYIVFNEWDWGSVDMSNQWFEKWVDIFPVLIDVVVKYNDMNIWDDIRMQIRKNIWKFNWSLTNDWEGTIAFERFLAPSYNHETDEIVFWTIYLFKQNYDYVDDTN